MPVPRFNPNPVERPAGLVPPAVTLTGVTELRLHGVGGATPADQLGDVAPQQVSGDRIAGFYRTADTRGRHVEAYSWGGLTSASGSRVLWLLLFPFALANLAGWMCTRATHQSRWRFRCHRTAVRWASLGLTVNLLIILAFNGMDLIGYQCGGRASCADRWLLAPLRLAAVADHPGRRVLLGALLPVGALAVLGVLTLRSIRRYEQVAPPVGDGETVARNRYSAAQPRFGLADPRFWDGRRGAWDLGFQHLATGLAVVALALAHTVDTISHAAGVPAAVPALRLAALAAGGAVVVGGLVLATLDTCPRRLPGALLTAAAAAVVAAAWFAAAQPALVMPDGPLPGLRNTANVGFAAILGTLLLVLLSAALGGRDPGGLVLGPFLALVLAVAVLNAMTLSTVVSLPRLLGASLAVPPVLRFSLPYLVLVPLAVILLFGIYQSGRYWWAGRGWREVQDWYQHHVPRPSDEPGWTVCASQGAAARRWAARVARSRRFARVPREADQLVTAMVVAGVLILVALQVRVWLAREPVWETAWTRSLSALLGLAVPVLLVLLLRSGWQSIESRKRIGVIWDVSTFWPRAYHPFAPPSYAERAVPELQRRLWRLHDCGGRVVLAAHSQGTVIAAAAMLQRAERPAGQRVALVTFGSPLRTLYRWAFPAYVHDDLLRRLLPGSGSGVELYGWRNLFYQTDYIGREVFAPPDPGVDRQLPDPGADRELPDPGVDRELPDPPSCWHIIDQPAPRPGSHAGYWTDPAVWREVDRFAYELAPRSPWNSP